MSHSRGAWPYKKNSKQKDSFPEHNTSYFPTSFNEPTREFRTKIQETLSLLFPNSLKFSGVQESDQGSKIKEKQINKFATILLSFVRNFWLPHKILTFINSYELLCKPLSNVKSTKSQASFAIKIKNQTPPHFRFSHCSQVSYETSNHREARTLTELRQSSTKNPLNFVRNLGRRIA
jgi:hypothetical protein